MMILKGITPQQGKNAQEQKAPESPLKSGGFTGTLALPWAE
jgi:hypothetical protein